MEKFRELGFNGTFDLVYLERYKSEPDQENSRRSHNITDKLSSLIPEFPNMYLDGENNTSPAVDPIENRQNSITSKIKSRFKKLFTKNASASPKDLENQDYIPPLIKEFETPTLGKVTCTRYTTDQDIQEPKHTVLTVSPGRYSNPKSDADGCDPTFFEAKDHCDHFIAVQPQGWGFDPQFVRDNKNGAEAKEIESPFLHSIASSDTAHKRPPKDTLKPSENSIIDICADNRYASQLMYGIYVMPMADLTRNAEKEQTKADEQGKPLVIILPQSNLFSAQKKEELRNEHNIIFTDVKTLEGKKIPFSDSEKQPVYVLETGPLSKATFDYLLIKGTDRPPYIEGKAATELCFDYGRDFYHSGVFIKTEPTNKSSSLPENSRKDKLTEALDLLGIGYDIGVNRQTSPVQPEQPQQKKFVETLLCAREGKNTTSKRSCGFFTGCFGTGSTTDVRSR